MKINKSCKLFLRDVYSYDIEACHYNILKNMGYDVSQINFEDKTKRNIQIGKLMKNNKRLTGLLRDTTESIIDEYILRSGLSEDDIITRQYDGLITSRPLKELNTNIPLKLKNVLEYMIISIGRSSYIAKSGSKVEIKGVPHRYKKIDNVLKSLLNINYLSKDSIFSSLEKIKRNIIFSDDPELFFIIDEGNNYGIIKFKEYGQLEINKSSVNIIDTDDIDKEFYFDHYIRPFTESITMEFI